MRMLLLSAALCAALGSACLGLGSGPTAAAGAGGSGVLVVLDANSGREIARMASNDVVDAVAADGHGGWFVGGSFTRIGGERRIGLAHVFANGDVDPGWRAWIGGASGRRARSPRWPAPGRSCATGCRSQRAGGTDVYRLALAGSRLYLGGGGGLSALDACSGARISLPAGRSPHEVLVLAISGRHLLVAGRG